jgi:beta-fructofuranosidase
VSLRLSDKWVWDFWLANDGAQQHIFYLQAPRSLKRSDLRHHHASIGHAVSQDLRTWEVVADALHPGSAGSWDDLATWTGSILEHDGRWHMLYTGINRRERGLIQRIGLAVSDDLVRWTKHPANPLIEADSRWYELLDLDRWRDQSWRDPWVYPDAATGAFRALITARSPEGDPGGAGVIAQATSFDLVHWDVLPSLTQPGEFAQVECPQLVSIGDRELILFSTLDEDHSASRCERLGAPGVTGTFSFSSVGERGSFVASPIPIADSRGRLGPLYAGKLVEAEPDEWRFMAFRGAGNRAFVGEITEPLPLEFGVDGHLRAVIEDPLPVTE